MPDVKKFSCLESYPPEERGYPPGTCLEAVDDAQPHVVVVLPASPGVNVQVGSSRVEVAGFEACAPTVPHPHIQASSELDDTGIGTGAGVGSFVECNGGYPETTVSAA